ncbi:MAG: hypothetical protein M0036_15950 [Desulfobacteraceae bacterium]|nr:hypothetical protein [Desulfobacteraceae bacterium]
MRKLNKSTLIILVLSLVALIGYGCDSGSSSVCTATTTVSNTAGAKLYYPCTISGAIPATTMMSGFMGTYSEVEWLARDVASNGYVVLAMTPTNLLGMVSGWRAAHQSGIAKLKSLNTSGTLRGKINTSKLQVCGHSKGGGGALWASSNLGSQLKSTIGMAPWQEEFLSLSGVRAATLIQAGGLDTLATGVMTLNEFNLLPFGITKDYQLFPTADHMSWSSLGTNHPALSASVVSWMNRNLK